MNRRQILSTALCFLLTIFYSSSCKSPIEDSALSEPNSQIKTKTFTSDELVIYPPFRERFSCTEHADGELQHLGDALGRDCLIVRLIDENGRLWLRSHKNRGQKNQDWYTWGAEVLAPITGKVSDIYANSEVNKPGIMGKGRAASIIFEREDGVKITLAHLQEIKVKVGDKVQAGDVVGTVGNNGYSRHPHIHIGAWHGEWPLQVRIDLKAQGAMMNSKTKDHSKKSTSKKAI